MGRHVTDKEDMLRQSGKTYIVSTKAESPVTEQAVIIGLEPAKCVSRKSKSNIVKIDLPQIRSPGKYDGTLEHINGD